MQVSVMRVNSKCVPCVWFLVSDGMFNFCVPLCRYADLGYTAVGHPPNAGKRPSPLLLRLFHLWHRRGPAVGGATAQPLLPGRGHQNVRKCLVIKCLHFPLFF